jgi:hypothetical protein
MKRVLTALMAVLSVALVSGVLLAQSMDSKTSERAPVALRTFQGDIVAVDFNHQEFTVRETKNGGVEEMTFHVPLDSKIKIDGSPSLLADLEKGDYVRVTYETLADMIMAKEVNGHKA